MMDNCGLHITKHAEGNWDKKDEGRDLEGRGIKGQMGDMPQIQDNCQNKTPSQTISLQNLQDSLMWKNLYMYTGTSCVKSLHH